jgi:hypothetical protein
MNDRPQRQEVKAILRDALGAALDRRLLTLFTAVVLSTTAVAAFPMWRVMASQLDRSPRSKEIAESFDLLAFADIGVAFFRSAAPVTGAVVVATLLGALSWPFLAGMAVGAARGERPRTFVGWIEGGVVYYTRMLRIGFVAIVPLALVGGAATLAFEGARHYGRRAILESQAALGWRAALAVTIVVFVLVHATLELGRAAFGADDELRSGWRAWLRGVELMARHPLRVLGSYLAPTLASYVVAIPILIVRLRVSGPSAIELLLVFILTQLGVAALGWGRSARLYALTALARDHSPWSVTPADASESVSGAARLAPSGRSIVSRPGSA